MLRPAAIFAAIFVVVVIWSRAAAEESVLLIVGDSLSAGYGIDVKRSWPHLLQARLQERGYRQTVVNASISGETTAGGVRRIGALLDEHKPAWVVIALGANDGLRGFDITQTRQNLETMIGSVVEAGASPALVQVRIPPNYGPRYTQSFEAMFEQIGSREEVTYAPFLLREFALDPNAFQADGLHPTVTVQPLIVDTLWPSITALLKLERSNSTHADSGDLR